MQSIRPTKRAIVIGDEPLTGQCVEIARAHGIDVVGMATVHPRVTRLADELGIPVVRSDGDIASDLADVGLDGEVDVLMSIAHLRIVPDALLARADLALNFHDGPLPDLVGLNVTSWALLDDRRHHAITWHHMSSNVDRGDIATVREFAIADDETAFSLNARCYEAALSSFPDLARAIADGSVDRSPQPDRASTTFLRVDRPARILDPSAAAVDIDRLVRALDLGGLSANRIGVPLLRIGESWVAAHSSSVTAGAPSAPPSGPPATVVDARGDRIRLTTLGGEIELALRALDGSIIDAAELMADAALGIGDRLDPTPTSTVERFAALDRRSARHENAWAQRLSRLDPVTSLTELAEIVDSTSDLSVASRSWIDLGEVSVGTNAEAVAAIALTLARSAGADRAHLAVVPDRSTADTIASFGPLVRAPIADLRVDHVAAADLLAAVEAELAEITELGPFLADLIGRRPEVTPADPRVLLRIGEHVDLDRPGESTLLWFNVAAGRLRLRHRSDVPGDVARGWLERVESVLAALGADTSPAEIDVVTLADREAFETLNDTRVDIDTTATVDGLVWKQATATPDSAALTWGDSTVSYGDLVARADRLAARLRGLGAGPGTRVGLAVPRSVELVTSVLATLRTGAAYVPLDPAYPTDRLQHMVADSELTILVAGDEMSLVTEGLTVVDPSDVDPTATTETAGDLDGPGSAHAAHTDHTADDLAYVIYTSGSTGVPKGVMLEHGNVVNFFAAMDEVIDHDPPGVWLAVTSLSFDISVLELLWTLARGFHVVLKADSGARSVTTAPTARAVRAPASHDPVPTRPVSMSLFYFAAGDASAGVDGYRLLLEGARFADANGFEAVWTPERHFHEFGGAYPNPSVVGAAVAATTSRVAIRAGSVVLPLHSPVRVAEEWSVVDNLSGGRVGISFAPGWQPNDFVLNPSEYGRAREHLPHLIDTVRSLWRGEAVDLVGHDGSPVSTSTLPRPVQEELPVWLTSAGTPATFERAGALGLNVLTHLLGQNIDELAANLERYRHAWRAAGHPGEGHVTLMLHTYLDADRDSAVEAARDPMKAYLGTAVGLIRNMASSFPTFAGSGAADDAAFESLTDDEMDQLLDMAASRYLDTSGLFGTPEDAADVIARVAAVGVDEVACLIDFGVDTDLVLGSFDRLAETRRLVDERVRSGADDQNDTRTIAPHRTSDPDRAETVAELVGRHGVTHLQCTPSLAAMLLADPADRRSLADVGHLLLGGEALPVALARQLREILSGRFTNMYGPTETTIWSLVHEIDTVADGSIPIGRPIANTTVTVLDDAGRPLPVGGYGELHIGGLGVARGYHDRPELTAERFVDRDALGRTYATGDIVRLTSAGTVEFAGRSDNQLKIRGHRIELGEIESVLDRHPDVVQAIVVPRGDSIDPILAAFVVSTGRFEVDDLRAHAAAELPSVMIPDVIRPIDVLPLTPNGKVDRNALPAALPHDVVDGEATVPTADLVDRAFDDDSEGLVASLWSAALGRPLGLDDNFFEIGGHSLLAVRVFRQLEERSPGPIALTDVFRYPTVRTLGAHLRTIGAEVPAAARPNGAADTSSGSSADRPTADSGSARGARRRRALSRRGGGGS
ncbi:MAG: MupA/Atu3671 family FMN-dependent luciferase-like monooxygenase [Actinomycetota bacterium]